MFYRTSGSNLYSANFKSFWSNLYSPNFKPFWNSDFQVWSVTSQGISNHHHLNLPQVHRTFKSRQIFLVNSSANSVEKTFLSMPVWKITCEPILEKGPSRANCVREHLLRRVTCVHIWRMFTKLQMSRSTLQVLWQKKSWSFNRLSNIARFFKLVYMLSYTVSLDCDFSAKEQNKKNVH